MNKTNKKKIVIVGGGFSGAVLAQKLESLLPLDWDIYLLSKTNFITYNPLLPEVIGASVLPGHVQAPYRLMLKRTRIRMVTVDNIDYEKKVIHYHNDIEDSLDFDHLVLAAGVQANMKMLPGLESHTLPLKTVGDALYIRNKVIERLEQATIHADADRRKELTSFIILGGGFSGVESAGELEDFISSAQKYYKNVERKDCRISVIHGTDRLLPELSEKLSEHTLKNFKKRGIEVHLNARASQIEDEKVTLNNGETIEGATIICTIGTTAHDFISDPFLPLERGRIVTNPDLSVGENGWLWAIGDCAIIPNSKTGGLCPPTAQFADRQAKFLAKNIAASINGKPTQAFGYIPIGMMASIGHNKAVAEVFGVRFSGLIGFMIWRAVYLSKVPTFARKMRLFLEWTWSMFFPPDIAHLGFKRSRDD